MGDHGRPPEDNSSLVLEGFASAAVSFDRRLLEMSRKTAEEEERYKKEMEKYAVALAVLNIQCLMCVTYPASLKD